MEQNPRLREHSGSILHFDTWRRKFAKVLAIESVLQKSLKTFAIKKQRVNCLIASKIRQSTYC